MNERPGSADCLTMFLVFLLSLPIHFFVVVLFFYKSQTSCGDGTWWGGLDIFVFTES